MQRVYKNYKPLQQTYEGFKAIQIRYEDEVFEGIPICTVEFGAILHQPVLFTNGSQVPQAVELSWLKEHLSHLKKFFFKTTPDGSLTEVEEKDSELFVWLPPDTDTSELFLDNGSIVRARPIVTPPNEVN